MEISCGRECFYLSGGIIISLPTTNHTEMKALSCRSTLRGELSWDRLPGVWGSAKSSLWKGCESDLRREVIWGDAAEVCGHVKQHWCCCLLILTSEETFYLRPEHCLFLLMSVSVNQLKAAKQTLYLLLPSVWLIFIFPASLPASIFRLTILTFRGKSE